MLTGYAANTSGVVQTATPVPLQIDTSSLAPKATTELNMKVNLDSRSKLPTVSPLTFGSGISAPDPASYTNSNSATVYDSLGNPHVLQMYYAITSTTGGGVWDVYATCDGYAFNGDTAIGQMTFDTNGKLDLTATTVPFNLSVDLDAVATNISTVTTTVTNSATTPLDFVLDYTGTTQFGANFSTDTQSQDGFSAGNLSGFSVSTDGTIVGRYTNGQSATLGQVALANFKNPNGLQNMGNNMWAETATSGQPLVGTPASGNLGALQSSAVEESNVDLTAELVNMITAQRVYQANAQTIKTQDQVLQTLVNLR
jgi:flagellar hook protein FlgE